ncbi:nuclear bridge Ish domain protein Les1 [Schizosaccharomyces pombe]|uniref:Nuclear bridge Ish domain protein les1 n=1 Tax=Schizosaccharomyces pombe (strain 972 / ATCC 24843) TaxID=284812 RepID=LES1_SCHPO|nr:LEA domain protein [Schizosaccharomyces pombe]O94559.1 RecName: Full=Nuclear bridge Ish domain protein les1; AltName: Full=Lem-like enriched in stalks protein 1; Flags: Precursor [Schizosaccharomyces pombe 972h-]CAB16876.1 LEA domain protein [Schizosaccharomyces pombe]|eukprot:NP_593177.1 LEA domain protein [Schizosaccharomyces pombe]
MQPRFLLHGALLALGIQLCLSIGKITGHISSIEATAADIHDAPSTTTKYVQRTVYAGREKGKIGGPADSWPQRKLDDFLQNHGVKSLDVPPIETPSQFWRKPLQYVSKVTDKCKSFYEKEKNHASHNAQKLDVWIFNSWTNSELSRWLIKNKYEVPEPGTREQLLETVFQASMGDAISTNDELESWSNNLLLSMLDQKNITVPIGASHDDLIVLARRYYDIEERKSQDKVTNITDSQPAPYMKEIIHLWSDGRLIDFLRERNIPISVLSPRETLLKEAYANRFTPRVMIASNVLDGWSSEDLLDWIWKYNKRGSIFSHVAYNSRHELIHAAKLFYMDVASEWSSSDMASLNDSLYSHPSVSKQSTWTEEELKEELESFGELVPVPFSSTKAFERLLPHLYYYLRGPAFLNRIHYWQTFLGNSLKRAFVLSQ